MTSSISPLSPTAAPASAPLVAPGLATPGRARRRRRYLIVVAGLIVLVTALWWIMVTVGETIYSPADVLAVIAGQDVPGASFAIGTLRLPRAIVGLLVGLAFGIAGHVFQTLLRNNLASPDIIGITSGASAAAVFAILLLGWSGTAVSALAVVAGLVTAAVIYALSSGGGVLGGRLILIGIGVAAMFHSLISYVLLLGSNWDVPAAMRWLSGSLNGARWQDVPVLATAVLALAALILVLHRDLFALELGDPAATALGVRVERTRLLLVLAAVGLVSFATAATGPISFVAFLAGPIATMLAGRGNRSLAVPAALVGAALVLGADLAGQLAFSTKFPVGVVTGIVGAPYLIFLLIRTNRLGASA